MHNKHDKYHISVKWNYNTVLYSKRWISLISGLILPSILTGKTMLDFVVEIIEKNKIKGISVQIA